MPHPTLLPSLLTVEHFEVVKGSDRCSQITAHKFFSALLKHVQQLTGQPDTLLYQENSTIDLNESEGGL